MMNRIKGYKRKLQQLMKVAEKQHYHDLLVEYSNDIKKSWVVIKSIINKNKKPHIQGRFKIGENLITSDKELISKNSMISLSILGQHWLNLFLV